MADDEHLGWIGKTVRYIDGPLDGTTQVVAFERVWHEGRDLLRGIDIEFWPKSSEIGPAGQYTLSTREEDGPFAFVWQPYSPEESARLGRAKPRPNNIIPGRFEISDGRRAVPMVRAGDPSDKPTRMTAVYVGGPKVGRSEEFDVRVWATDEPGVVRVSGFDVWPTTPREFAPGRYEPETSGGGPIVPFIWREYTPDEREKRAEEIGYWETPPFD